MSKLNILFICTVNRMRSATAERIYVDDARFHVDSAGTDPSATTILDEYQLEWADYVIVMEPIHRKKIKQMFPDLYSSKPIICLYIRDEYDFMEPELIEILRQKIEHVYRTEIMP